MLPKGIIPRPENCAADCLGGLNYLEQRDLGRLLWN
jgi:hypothetical protein